MNASEFNKGQIIAELQIHPLIRLRHKVRRVFIVGSFARGEQTDKSDIDVLIEIRRGKTPELEIEDSYRNRIRDYFVKNNIRGVRDDLHPRYLGRRIDLYITYNAEIRQSGKPTIKL